MSADDDAPRVRTLSAHGGAPFEAGAVGRPRGEQLDGATVHDAREPALSAVQQRRPGTVGDGTGNAKRVAEQMTSLHDLLAAAQRGSGET